MLLSECVILSIYGLISRCPDTQGQVTASKNISWSFILHWWQLIWSTGIWDTSLTSMS